MELMRTALKDAAGEFDSLSAVLNYLGETADDQGLRMLLIQLSDRAVAAQADINRVLEGSEAAQLAQIPGGAA